MPGLHRSAATGESDDWESRTYSEVEDALVGKRKLREKESVPDCPALHRSAATEESDDWESRTYSELDDDALVAKGKLRQKEPVPDCPAWDDMEVGRPVPSAPRPLAPATGESEDWGLHSYTLPDHVGEVRKAGSWLEHGFEQVNVRSGSHDSENHEADGHRPQPVLMPCHQGRFIWFQLHFGGEKFEVTSKYQKPIRFIARGAYGSVCSAFDSKKGEHAAIKKISKPFGDRVSAKLALREVLLLRHMNHPNVLSLMDVVPPPRRVVLNDVYVVTQFMDTDLHKLIRRVGTLSVEQLQSYLYQLLCGLRYLHSANIIHRDLKPRNILVAGDRTLKICDLGQARRVPRDRKMSKRVGTLSYKAPEILLHSSVYTSAADVWSVGCIVVECLLGKTLFTGDNEENMLNAIYEVIGTPVSGSDLSFLDNIAQAEVARLAPLASKSLTDLIPGANKLVVELAEKMLVFCPQKRILIEDALEHPFLKIQHVPSTDSVVPPPPFFDFEDEGLSIEQIKDIIYELSMELNPDYRREVG